MCVCVLCVSVCASVYGREYIYHHHHHHHHVALVARISLRPSLTTLPYRFIALGRSPGQHPVSSHSC